MQTLELTGQLFLIIKRKVKSCVPCHWLAAGMAGIPTILSSFCNNTQTLYDFLTRKLSNTVTHVLMISKFSDQEFDTFLETTLVAPAEESISLPTSTHQSHTFRELLNTVISVHLNASRFRSHRANLLCLGYRPCGSYHGTMIVQNYYPNGLLGCTEASWERLLGIIGDEAMMQILLCCVILIRMGDGYLQVAGVPLTEMRRLDSAPPKEKQILQRFRLYYGHPNRNNQGMILPGLPFQHLLNKTGKLDRLIDRMFYRESQVKRYGSEWQKLKNLCETIVKRHYSCPYAQLLEYYCPDPTNFILGGLRASEKGAIQVVPRTVKNTIQAQPGIWHGMQSHRRVIGFIMAIIKRIFHADNRFYKFIEKSTAGIRISYIIRGKDFGWIAKIWEHVNRRMVNWTPNI